MSIDLILDTFFIPCCISLFPQRYLYYISSGVQSSMLAPQPPQQMKNIVGKLPPVTEDNSRDMQRLRASLLDEVNTD